MLAINPKRHINKEGENAGKMRVATKKNNIVIKL